MTTTSLTVPLARPRQRDGLTMAFGLWLMIGLFIDGYVHNTRGDQLESFLTPWHGVLYSGFVASALWIAWPALTTGGPWRDRLAVLPRGYGLGLLGVVIFAVGGVADGVWHTLLGIEVDLEALISPPHLLLFAGAMLILTTPLRAAWARPIEAPSLRSFLPALASITLAALLVGFFFMYASGLFDPHALAAFQVFAAAEFGAERLFLLEVLNAFGILARLVTTAFLMIPAVLLLRRWDPPRGSFTILFVSYGAFMLVLEDSQHVELLLPALVAGAVADALAGRLPRTTDRRRGVYGFATAVPATLWLAHFATLAAAGDLGWPFLLWGGVVLFAAGTGLILAVLAFPPPVPDRASEAPVAAR